METPLRVEMFGALRIVRGTQLVGRFQTQKTGALLAYLACYRDRQHSREELIELLWPEADPTAGRNRLKQALSVLRSQLEPADELAGTILQADRAYVSLNNHAVTTDVADFEAAISTAARRTVSSDRTADLALAVQIYRGGFLPGLYEDWAAAERERLADQYVSALVQLAENLEREGDYGRGIAYAIRAVRANVLREDARCLLMRLYSRDGRSAEAIRVYKELERTLKNELGEEPCEEAARLLSEIRGSTGPGSRQRASSPPGTSELGAPAVPAQMEPIGGAVPLSSAYYIERPADAEFETAISRRDSIVLVKGPREIGKTSLLARGLERARSAGASVILTDFQKLTDEQVQTADALFFTLAEAIADQLNLDVSFDSIWNPARGWNVNFERFLRREVLGKTDAHVVWGLDEIDRLFHYTFGTEVFGLFRSWHNERSLNPHGPWGRLTLAIGYATEAHLFITDLNQSPFNVGTRLTLHDFSIDDVAELNRRYGAPLQDAFAVKRFFALVGGSPHLIRRGLHEMVTRKMDIGFFETQAVRDDGPFRDHLEHVLSVTAQDPALLEGLTAVVRGTHTLASSTFYRLRSAGVLSGVGPESARPRCEVYRAFFERRLP